MCSPQPHNHTSVPRQLNQLSCPGHDLVPVSSGSKGLLSNFLLKVFSSPLRKNSPLYAPSPDSYPTLLPVIVNINANHLLSLSKTEPIITQDVCRTCLPHILGQDSMRSSPPLCIRGKKKNNAKYNSGLSHTAHLRLLPIRPECSSQHPNQLAHYSDSSSKGPNLFFWPLRTSTLM